MVVNSRFEVQRSVDPHRASESAVVADGGENAPFMSSMRKSTDIYALYEEEEEGGVSGRQKVAQVLRKLSHYSPAVQIVPGPEVADEDGILNDKEKEAAAKKKAAKMGTFMGVFMPCVQNIFGVLFFIRMAWIVGTAGVVESFFIVLMCCMVTFLTSISLSAIATNGMVPGGGPYYMISRNLGPELGGAVGILFYLGTTIAASMYIIGAVEILMLYLVTKAQIFDNAFHNFRLLGTLFLIVIGLVVMAGVRVVNKFALPAVVTVILCIFLTFVGVFVKFNGSTDLKYCAIGDRLVNLVKIRDKGLLNATNCSEEALKAAFCPDGRCGDYFSTNSRRIGWKNAIVGLSSDAVHKNAYSRYMSQGEILSKNEKEMHVKPSGNGTEYYVLADIATSFMILVGVYFPSVTGIMAGSNRSGDLRDPSVAIPRGTIAATSVTSLVYISGSILLGALVDPLFIRDKFGESAMGSLIVAEVAVPHRLLILIGCFMSTIGAGMQSLTGAPRLFQAIAKDGIIPILHFFEPSTRFGEPLRAQLLTLSICEIGILIAQLESVTALITQFFLMCYLSVNAACALQGILKTPGWRPSFKYYHWTLSLLGAALCIAVMFISHWGFALLAIVIGAVVYKYIEYRGAEKEWGDGLRGLTLSAARYALMQMEQGPPHTKNWRPQVLLLVSTESNDLEIQHSSMFAFARQLKHGKGLTVIAAVLVGEYRKLAHNAIVLKEKLRKECENNKIKGFTEVLVAENCKEGISSLIQTCGLGGLKPNTVIVSWPDEWKSSGSEKVRMFTDTVRNTTAAKCALLVLKNVDNFPTIKDRLKGTIDVWWVVHDGGMLMLLPFLLRQHRVWRHCQLRVFTVAQLEDNSLKMKDDIKRFMRHLRIEAEVEVVEMQDRDISDYTYERTLRMEQRSKILRELRLSDRERDREIQSIIDTHHQVGAVTDRKLSAIVEEANIGLSRFGANELQTPDTDYSHLVEEDEVETDRSLPFIDISTTTADVASGEDLTLPNSASSLERSNISAASKALPIQNGPTDARHASEELPQSSIATPLPALSGIKPDEYNLHRMHTAVNLNAAMKERSANAQLLIINLPGAPRRDADENYMEFVEVLTAEFERVLLIRGSGREVITIYS